MVKWLHTVCLRVHVCVCGRDGSLLVQLSMGFGLELVHVCVLETPKPPLTPDLLKSHDTPSIPTKHSEGRGQRLSKGIFSQD